MRVLFLCPFLPSPPNTGGRMRVAGLLREGSRRHSIHLLAIAHASEEPASAGELRAFCEAVETFPLVPPARLRAILVPKTVRRGRSPALADRARELLPRFDLVHFAEPSLVPAVPRAARAAAVVDHPKIDYLLHREVAVLRSEARLRIAFDVWKERRHLRRVLRTVATHTTCSREDADRLQSLSPEGAFFVVPNAVDPRFLEPLPSPPDGEERILFCGSPDYEPNLHAIRLLVREILPRVRRERPRVRLVLVGRGAGPGLRALAAEGEVEFAGEVPDVLPHLASARAVVLPLKATGGGTRFKAIEAMAAGRPVVATAAACEGLGAEPSRHFLAAEDAEATARALLRILGDPGLARRLSAEAAALVRERLTRGRAAAALEEAWRHAGGAAAEARRT